MTIRWARDATLQLVAAHAYVAADNPGAADELVLKIVAAVAQLKFHPRMGREGRVKHTRELIIPNTPYIVAYRLRNEAAIQILAVLHGKRRWPESF